jgi:aryl-alcohol dehydrogenase-like predicted oxidoreductase
LSEGESFVIKGYATAEAAADYARRFPALPGHFRPLLGIPVSSIGLGTYLGNDDERDDEAYAQALKAALLGGINLVDSAINYRFQRSERVIGQVLAQLTREASLTREQVIVATKGGFVPFEGNPLREMEERFIRAGLIRPDEWVESCHCIAPPYLDTMVETSRHNLNLETIDVYYLHNPETQLAAVDRVEFRRRIRAAFELLERKAAEGKIGVYGTATWSGYRTTPNAQDYLSLEEMVQLAHEVGGTRHHFKMIQLPYNLAMLEAFTHANQSVNGRRLTLLKAARELGIGVCVSATLLQGRLTRGLPARLRAALAGLRTDAQRAIQFVRSTPDVGTALVGMKSAAHVRENLETAARPPLSPQEIDALFSE